MSKRPEKKEMPPLGKPPTSGGRRMPQVLISVLLEVAYNDCDCSVCKKLRKLGKEMIKSAGGEEGT